MTTAFVSNEIDDAIAFEGVLRGGDDASSSSAIPLEISGFVCFQQLFAGVESQPSAGATLAAATNNESLEAGDASTTHNE